MDRLIVWVAAAFAGGIALGRLTALSAYTWLGLGTAAMAAAAALLRRGRLPFILLLAAVASAGALTYAREVVPPSADLLLRLAGRQVALTGVVAYPPLQRGDRTRLIVAVERLAAAGEPERPARGRVLVHAGPSATVRYGDRVRLQGLLRLPETPGNAGEFSPRDHLAAQGIHAVLYMRRGAAIRALGRAPSNPLLAAAYGLRSRMLAFFSSALPGDRGALLASLLLGDEGGVPADLRNAFARAGLLHVLVVSGAQVGLVAAAVIWMGRVLRAPPLAQSAAAAGAVLFFSMMTGWVPSVARAAVMALVGLLATALGRLRDPVAGLALAALLLLGSAPLLLTDVGFQLSFVATWALIYVAPALQRPLGRLPASARALVAMTVAAQSAVMPLLAYHFLQVSVSGFAANLAVVPLIALLVPAGFLVAACGLLFPGLGGMTAHVLAPVLDAVAFLARLFAAMPLAVVAVPPPSPLLVAGSFAALIGLVEWLRGTVRPRLIHVAAAGLCAAALLVGGETTAALAPPRVFLTALDVGQGDALLIQGPSGRTVLVDGGGEIEGHATGYDVGARRVVPALRRLGVRHLDLMVLSHPHEDHVGGLVAVLQNFRVGLVLDAGLPHPAPSYAQFLRLIEARRIPYRLARRGMRADLGDGLILAVLHPEEPLVQGTSSDANNNSIILRLTYGRVSALLTGDAEALIEAQLLERGDDVRSTILKVAHHGSRTSTTAAFVDAVRPAVAIISVGASNPFGHPDPAVIARLEDGGAAVYRTDRHGAVTVTTDGRRMWVRTVRDAGDH